MAILTTQEELELQYEILQKLKDTQRYRVGAGREQELPKFADVVARIDRLKTQLALEAGGDSMSSIGYYGGVE